MKRACFYPTMVVVILLGPTLLMAQSGIPDLSNCEAWLAYDGPETPVLMVIPNGEGPSFTAALLPDGSQVDATVFLLVQDWGDNPIANFPFEDMWIESFDDGLVPCTGGSNADVDTDMNGMTHWIEPMNAGGQSQDLTGIFVNGDNVSGEGLRLSFNSPDINGDLMVSLHDVSIFANDFFGSYNFRSDLHPNGLINLSDLGRLALGFGANCP